MRDQGGVPMQRLVRRARSRGAAQAVVRCPLCASIHVALVDRYGGAQALRRCYTCSHTCSHTFVTAFPFTAAELSARARADG